MLLFKMHQHGNLIGQLLVLLIFTAFSSCTSANNDIHLKTVPKTRIKFPKPELSICVSSISECSLHCKVHPNCSFVNFGLVNIDPSTCCQRTCESTCESTCFIFKMADNITCDNIENKAGWTILCKYKRCSV